MGANLSRAAPTVDPTAVSAEQTAILNPDGSLTKWGTRFEDPELKEIVLRTDANKPQVEDHPMDEVEVTAPARGGKRGKAAAAKKVVEAEGVGADVELVVQGIAIKAPKAATAKKTSAIKKAPAAKKAPASVKKVQAPKKLPAQKVGMKRVAAGKKKGAQRRQKPAAATA